MGMLQEIFVDGLTEGAIHADISIASLEKGGPGSGNFGHAGRPGLIGGSGSGGFGSEESDTGNKLSRLSTLLEYNKEPLEMKWSISSLHRVEEQFLDQYLGPRQWKSVKEYADAVIKRIEQGDWQKTLGDSTLSEAYKQKIGDPKELLLALKKLSEKAERGMKAAKKLRQETLEKLHAAEEEATEKFPGMKDVKIYDTVKEAQESMKGIARLEPGEGKENPFVNMRGFDPKIASLMADEAKTLAAEYPAEWRGLGYFGRQMESHRYMGYYNSKLKISSLVQGEMVYTKDTYRDKNGNEIDWYSAQERVLGLMRSNPNVKTRMEAFRELGIEYESRKIVRGRRKSGVGREEREWTSEDYEYQEPGISFKTDLFKSVAKAYVAHGNESESDFHDGMRDLRSTVRHEFAHHLRHNMNKSAVFSGKVNGWINRWSGRHKEISGYAAKNPDEFFAETFAAARYGDDKRKNHEATKELMEICMEYQTWSKEREAERG